LTLLLKCRFGSGYEDSLWKLDPVDLVRSGREKLERAWHGRRLSGA
jgi:hypothetical protein